MLGLCEKWLVCNGFHALMVSWALIQNMHHHEMVQMLTPTSHFSCQLKLMVSCTSSHEMVRFLGDFGKSEKAVLTPTSLLTLTPHLMKWFKLTLMSTQING
jgi:hypothetical protein